MQHAREVRLLRIHAEAVSSADESRLLPFAPRNADDEALDRIARRTLRDCMQTVFEDGPKRDRRLWLGDLRLQALANYATYRNYDLVKRSLYILAGTATDKGLVGTCPSSGRSRRGGNTILDYTALFAHRAGISGGQRRPGHGRGFVAAGLEAARLHARARECRRPVAASQELVALRRLASYARQAGAGTRYRSLRPAGDAKAGR